MESPHDRNKEELTISVMKANIFGVILLLPTTLIFGLPYYLRWHEDFVNLNLLHLLASFSYKDSLMAILALTIGIVFHELIHGIVWSGFTKKGFKAIRFGIEWKLLTPYCHCNEPLKVWHYILGAIMPAIVLGIFPATVSIASGSIGMLIFGIFFTIAAGGDILTTIMLMKENMNNHVQDHPTEIGCFIYR